MKDRGIVLITTMLLLMFIIMISTLLVVSGRNSLRLGASYAQRERAFYAAESGVAYIQRMLLLKREYTAQDGYNPSSFAGASTDAVDGDNVHLVVKKLNGSGVYNGVHGIVEGNSHFYVAFCDGATPVAISDGANPLQYYSYNGMAKNPGVYGFSFHRLSAVDVRQFRKVKDGMAHIIVEGRAGQVVRYVEVMLGQTIPEYFDSAIMGGGKIDVDLFDDSYKFAVNDSFGRETNLRSILDCRVNALADDGDGDTKMNEIMTVSGSSITGLNAHTIINGVSSADPVAFNEYDVSAKQDATQQDKISLMNRYAGWSKMSTDYLQADNSYKGTVVGQKFRSGTYIYLENQSALGSYDLAYIPYLPGLDATNEYNYAQLMNRIANGTYNTSDKSLVYLNSVSGDVKNWKTVGNQNIFFGNPDNVVFLKGADGKTGFNITNVQMQNNYLLLINDAPVGVNPATVDIYNVGSDVTGYGFCTLVADYSSLSGAYALSDVNRSSIGLKQGDDGTETAKTQPGFVVTGDFTAGAERMGDLVVEGELSGQGTVVTTGNLVFQGKSQLEPSKDSALSIYAKSDIQIKPITGEITADPTETLLATAYGNLNTACGGDWSDGKDADDRMRRMRDNMLGQSSGSDPLSDALDDLGYDDGDRKDLVESYLRKNCEYDSDDHEWDLGPAPTPMAYADCVLKGLVFSERDIRMNVKDKSITIQGALVAFGGAPDKGEKAGDPLNFLGEIHGNISIRSGNATMTYDSTYLYPLFKHSVGIDTIRVFWNTWNPGRILNLSEVPAGGL